jgi:GxxExxY protein
MLRAHSPLAEEDERVVERVIGCGIRIHRGLGPGFLEAIYRNAFCIELQLSGIAFELEKTVVIQYRDQPVGLHRLDFVVGEVAIVELKAVRSLEPVHEAQLFSYLKATGLRVGLLMNFGDRTLKAGLKRIVL